MKYDWLNDDQKKKLQAVYNTVQFKDIVDQAFDNFNLGLYLDARNSTAQYSAFTYMFHLQKILQACNRPDFLAVAGTEAERKEAIAHVEGLIDFFRVLDSESFDTLNDIYEAANASGRHDEAIDTLYNKTREKYRAKLEAMNLSVDPT